MAWRLGLSSEAATASPLPFDERPASPSRNLWSWTSSGGNPLRSAKFSVSRGQERRQSLAMHCET
eukprot:3009258-Amphidinium_carterae.1